MRSQPPFLSDLIQQVYARLEPSPENKEWLRRGILGAIKEYHTVWQSPDRLDIKTGLSRFRPDGLGIPPETEASHFTSVLTPYAEALGVSVNEFAEMYNAGEVDEPLLDTYFLHDRAVRESGHDTTSVLLSSSWILLTDSQISIRETMREFRHNRPLLAALQVRDGHRQHDSRSLQRLARGRQFFRSIRFPVWRGASVQGDVGVRFSRIRWINSDVGRMVCESGEEEEFGRSLFVARGKRDLHRSRHRHWSTEPLRYSRWNLAHQVQELKLMSILAGYYFLADVEWHG